MKKFLALFIAVLSVLTFNSCEEKKEIIEYKLFGDSSGATNIVIHEVNDNGDILKKRSIYELKENEYSLTYTADENATGANVYYKSKRLSEYLYFRNFKILFADEENIISVSSNGREITEEEYNFLVNQ
ncbi:MAG: hypothetical protein U0J38_03335 [Bacteroidales bacterium]|nr:hypothetical protein [Bacteroidales bacterium]